MDPQEIKTRMEEVKRMYEEFLSELKALRSRQREEMHELTQKLVEKKLAEVSQRIKEL
jgi:glutamyl-tRNA reductase